MDHLRGKGKGTLSRTDTKWLNEQLYCDQRRRTDMFPTRESRSGTRGNRLSDRGLGAVWDRRDKGVGGAQLAYLEVLSIPASEAPVEPAVKCLLRMHACCGSMLSLKSERERLLVACRTPPRHCRTCAGSANHRDVPQAMNVHCHDSSSVLRHSQCKHSRVSVSVWTPSIVPLEVFWCHRCLSNYREIRNRCAHHSRSRLDFRNESKLECQSRHAKSFLP
jgi:hypothetical protein